jgi:hypothetical protein
MSFCISCEIIIFLFWVQSLILHFLRYYLPVNLLSKFPLTCNTVISWITWISVSIDVFSQLPIIRRSYSVNLTFRDSRRPIVCRFCHRVPVKICVSKTKSVARLLFCNLTYYRYQIRILVQKNSNWALTKSPYASFETIDSNNIPTSAKTEQ